MVTRIRSCLAMICRGAHKVSELPSLPLILAAWSVGGRCWSEVTLNPLFRVNGKLWGTPPREIKRRLKGGGGQEQETEGREMGPRVIDKINNRQQITYAHK